MAVSQLDPVLSSVAVRHSPASCPYGSAGLGLARRGDVSTREWERLMGHSGPLVL